MAEWLLLRLAHTPDEPATWVVADARGAVHGPPQSGPLALAAARAAGRRVCVAVPGADVLLAEPEVPVRAGAKLAQLVPYALEEQLAEDVESLHFAIGKRAVDSTRVPVAVVGRALLSQWLRDLRASGIEPAAIHVESDLLPRNPGKSVALLDEDAITVRPPTGAPVSIPADALDQALELAQAQAETTGTGARGLILYTGAAEWRRHSAQIEAARERFDGIQVQLLTGGPLTLFAQQLPEAAAINLLQGEYAPVRASNGGWRAWRLAALLLAGLIGLHVAGKAAELSLLKRNERKLDSSIRETFSAAMPGEVSGPEPRRRMEQRLNAARNVTTTGLLPALDALAHASAAAPGTLLQSLNFHNNVLELKVSAPDATSLENLTQGLRSSGWPADLLGGGAAGPRYEGRIEVHSHP